jgi:hypothetical protein
VLVTKSLGLKPLRIGALRRLRGEGRGSRSLSGSLDLDGSQMALYPRACDGHEPSGREDEVRRLGSGSNQPQRGEGIPHGFAFALSGQEAQLS